MITALIKKVWPYPRRISERRIQNVAVAPLTPDNQRFIKDTTRELVLKKLETLKRERKEAKELKQAERVLRSNFSSLFQGCFELELIDINQFSPSERREMEKMLIEKIPQESGRGFDMRDLRALRKAHGEDFSIFTFYLGQNELKMDAQTNNETAENNDQVMEKVT